MKTIITEKMVFGGDCLAKIEGKNVFVPFALPGENNKLYISRYTYCKNCKHN